MKKYFNRELSWLEFNRRVLGESFDQENPLGEQLNFLSIFSSNLDEFFMVRVGSLWDQLRSGVVIKDVSDYTPEEQIDAINLVSKEMVKRQYERYKELRQQLSSRAIEIVDYDDLDEEDKKQVTDYYFSHIYPLVTPVVIDKNSTFPLIANKTINLFVLMEKHGKVRYGNVQVPYQVQRLLELKNDQQRKFVTIESVLRSQLKNLYPAYKIEEVATYRITRNADLDYNEEEAQDLLIKIENLIQQRKWGKVVRVEISENISPNFRQIFKDKFLVDEREIYEIGSHLDLTFLMTIYKKKWFKSYRFPPFMPRKIIDTTSSDVFFKWVDEKDRIYHLPYDDFSAVLNFINLAAHDEKVLAIKQTLYRVSKNSPIIDALELAAHKGKNVTVLLELKARFDEENNIHWSKRLEKAGVHVIHGPRKLKTHSKMLLVVRKEKDDQIKTYCHLATGNYNEKTASVYEDVGLFTANPSIGSDGIEIFNFLASQIPTKDLKVLKISPYQARDTFESMLAFEMEEAKAGRKAHVRCKMNSLVDEQMMDKLYEASAMGVEIELIVRGICTLIPNENIRIKSIVGRFLEHSRIYYFYQGGAEKTYISSLDWMERNFNKRVELLVPVLDQTAKKQVLEILNRSWEDTMKSYYLQKDGTYVKMKKKNGLNVQKYFLSQKENSEKE